MKKRGLSSGIVLAILAHSLLAVQSPLPDPEQPRIYLVLLKAPCVAEKIRNWNPEGSASLRRQLLQSPEASLYRLELEQYQDRFLDRLARIPSRKVGRSLSRRLKVLDRRTYLLNMLVVEGLPDEIEKLREEEEVEGIFPNEKRFPLLDAAPGVVGASPLWESLGGVNEAGRGIRIAIIDSGINQEHPMFRANSLTPPDGFPLGDMRFTNSKVIVARNYVRTEFGLKNQENKTPEDELGHGSRVAGIASGASVQTPQGQIQGIAPVSFLGNYKVFGHPSINPSTTLAAVTAAIEDAVADGMDVINLSLGGPARNPDKDPEQRAIAMAVEAGVVVVASAGNTGPGPRSITSPGTSPAAITVGATSNGRVFASGLEITSGESIPAELERIAYVPANGTNILEPIGPLPVVSVASLDATELVCEPLPELTLDGKVVLIARGSCLFATKAENVFAAGAEGMVVYSNVAGSAIVMGGLENFPMPSVMIEQHSGEALRDLILTLEEAELTFRPESEVLAFPSQADIVTGFSSRGPGLDFDIKPDLTAPGENIHSASKTTTPQPQFSLRSSGTSFAAPMVAGAAALLKQLHQDWTNQLPAAEFAKAIKSAVVNTAAKTPTWKGQPARLIHAGNGRLDLTQALATRSTLDPVSLSFGLLSGDDTTQLVRTLQLINLGPTLESFRIDVSPLFRNDSVQVSASPTALSLSRTDRGNRGGRRLQLSYRRYF